VIVLVSRSKLQKFHFFRSYIWFERERGQQRNDPTHLFIWSLSLEISWSKCFQKTFLEGECCKKKESKILLIFKSFKADGIQEIFIQKERFWVANDDIAPNSRDIFFFFLNYFFFCSSFLSSLSKNKTLKILSFSFFLNHLWYERGRWNNVNAPTHIIIPSGFFEIESFKITTKIFLHPRILQPLKKFRIFVIFKLRAIRSRWMHAEECWVANHEITLGPQISFWKSSLVAWRILIGKKISKIFQNFNLPKLHDMWERRILL